jgi:hypothetical protein
MNTKIVMISSVIFLGALGITLTFIPDEIISGLRVTPNPMSILSLQLLGALYLGFAMLNWLAKESLIGGIYNRPTAIGNFIHFTVGAMALIKIITKIQTYSEIVISLTTVYVIFAILFGYVFRTNPSRIEKKE